MLKQQGYDLLGAAFEVYNELGYGMAEEVYQQSLEILTAKYRPDLLVYGEIVVELKSLKELCSDHEAQLFNYMRIARKQVGYLINFGQKGELEWKRFVLSDLHKIGDNHRLEH